MGLPHGASAARNGGVPEPVRLMHQLCISGQSVDLPGEFAQLSAAGFVPRALLEGFQANAREAMQGEGLSADDDG